MLLKEMQCSRFGLEHSALLDTGKGSGSFHVSQVAEGSARALGCLWRHLAQHFLGAVPALPWGLVLQPARHRNRGLTPVLCSMRVQMIIFRGSSQMQYFYDKLASALFCRT